MIKTNVKEDKNGIIVEAMDKSLSLNHARRDRPGYILNNARHALDTGTARTSALKPD